MSDPSAHASPPSAARPPRRSGVVVPRRVGWSGELVSWLIHLLLVGVGRTLRITIDDPHGFLADRSRLPIIFAIWHNRLALAPTIWNIYRQTYPGVELAALISASKDGALLARTLERLRMQPVRGSSSRRGAQALRELTTWIGRGYSIAITPDGPRGPKYTVQEGIVALAQLTGRLIIPVGVEIARKWQLKSWDRFQIPLPFTQCRVRVGVPLAIPRRIDPPEREKARRALEQALIDLNPD